MKYLYEDLGRDERTKEMEDLNGHEDFDHYMRDRESGINADPSEGPRDGVVSVKRMHPDRYIKNGGCN